MIKRLIFFLLLSSLSFANPQTEKLQLRLLIVVYTSSFAHTLTPAQVERLHQEVAEFVDFYRESAGDVLDLDLTLLQIDRRLELHEVQEISKGRYYLSRENIEAELVQRGMKGRDFDEVICFYAWDEQNRYGARLAYGGGAVGPDGKFLDDAGYNSIGVFAWDPGRISQIMIHEVLHNIDDMFSRSGMPEAFYSSDDMSRHIDELVRDWPGAFEPDFSDAQILDLAERERKGEEGYPWKAQLVYYRWLLRRTPREAWMRLKYGRRIEVSQETLSLRPLYSTWIYSAANDSLYLPVLLRDGRNRHVGDAEVVVRTGSTPLPAVSYAHTDFEGKAVFRNAFYAGWVAARKKPGRLTIQARTPSGKLTASVALEPVRTAVIDVPAEQTFYRDRGKPARLQVAVRQERFGGKGELLENAVVTATVGGKRILLKEETPGRYVAEPIDLSVGPNPVVLRATKEGWTILPASSTVYDVMSWDLETAPVVEAQRGMPLEIWVRAVRNEPIDDVVVFAQLGKMEVPMEPVGDGTFMVRFPTVPDDVDSLRLIGRKLGAGAEPEMVLEKRVALRARYRGQIVAEDEIHGKAGQPVKVSASVRNRMGEMLIGYAVPLVVVVGAEVVPLLDADGDGRFVGEVTLPAGLYRAKIVALDGRVGMKNLRIRVEE
jgi:hypothetical protein